MKYKIINEESIKILVEFLDELQFDAAESEDYVLVKFIQEMVTEIINSDEVFDDEGEAIKYLDKMKNNKNDPYTDYYNYFKNYKKDIEKDLKKLLPLLLFHG